MPTLTTRLCFLTPRLLAMIGTLMVGGSESSFALDPPPRSPRVGLLQIPLHSYTRVPISKLLSDPASYHLRQIRITGTVHTAQTQVMTQGCGVPDGADDHLMEYRAADDVLDKELVAAIRARASADARRWRSRRFVSFCLGMDVPEFGWKPSRWIERAN